uniref:Uncharacterized protein n=1 Tax=Proboscia inermis TaxID=420281 RepID=A0A7S0C0T6_9STRA|mmetsp:Transcript_18143/g.18377  ORF Transcript_18143/g.18377 Transcript_18143/m.18377 type:complete len:204 (+) Transcript_18143:2-613(+)
MQHINTFESTLISLLFDVHNMKTWAQRIQSLKQSFRLLPNEHRWLLNDKNGNHPQIRDALPQGTTPRNEQISTLTGSTKRKPRETNTIHPTNDNHKVVSRDTIHQNTRHTKPTINDNHHPIPTQNDTIRNKCHARLKKKKNNVKKKKVTTKTITDEQYQQMIVLDQFFGTDTPALRKHKNKDPSSTNQHPQHKSKKKKRKKTH